jgi:DNA-binding XRE family transcriptional regulator
MQRDGLERTDPKTRKLVLEQMRELSQAMQMQRRKVGLTQETLAEALDVSVNTIKYIEQGRRLPSLIMLLRIANVLKLKLSFQKA